ncbi:hypothetical protein BKA64DRAFT_565464 [Cadophora sp. MPI-SDFR-AT-0126]|nr:hypothetical protein BKA61DRAFT_496072 [Leptodontidium sp. MPI-SDFR-AT-0119]KAH7418891.1 hypothetical protein BKA64DRAFT_565464 [Leotiomycetes sp. MPI-SDFR-AT-0126]
MKLSILVGLASGIFGVHASTNAVLDAIVSESSANIISILEARTASNSSDSCNSENVVVRREWAALSSVDKINYIDAVKCMMNTSAITPLSAAPGVRTRFDDFAALHINSTSVIHWTSRFFTWHRYYTWLYEKALREECGYEGYQPYWDWSSTDTLTAHPLFDGSETSIGGDGEAIPHSPYILLPTPTVINVTSAVGTGGGCIVSGPFANVTINLGPHGQPVHDRGLNYNPRCLTRDIRENDLRSLTYDNVAAVMVQDDFQTYATLVEVGGGLHSSGHGVLGGFQDDLWGSAQDPSFHFHHGQVDRLWALWQGVNQTVRTKEVASTLTIMNLPPSEPGTLDTVVDMGYMGPSMTIGELSSTIDGPFCYIYA